ncbi:hypothetical protein ZOSMA_8G01660 [Zostera marina]|uniref:DDE Tnp4 domain-containing protein n=1 Tax=Zostera marina TaxID=29655 RepID=A0A0K9NLP5_ZOSMR|nr:hypothetical protein ZOSMA_8G01660 [Zostera marina]
MEKKEEQWKSLASSSSSMAFLLSIPPFPSLSPIHVILPQLLLLSTSDRNQGRKRKLSQREDQDGEDGDGDERKGELMAMLSRTACPDQFRIFFMMTSSTFQYLSGLLDPLLDCQQPPSLSSSSSTSRLAIALHRLATGCPYEEIARRFGVSTSTAQFWTKRLCRVLCTNFRFWFSFPSSPFSSVNGHLPNCCGAIVSSRFKIADGSRVLTQIVSDPNSKILNLSVGHRGLKSSSIFQTMTADDNKGRYLVGGIRYPLLPWLMVPFGTSNSKEMEFNKVHSEMLRPAQRALRWVRKWGILRGGVVDEDKKMAVACIATCSVLNNVMLMREDRSVLDLSDDDKHEIYTEEEEEEEDVVVVDEEGFNIRKSLAENIFQKLPSSNSLKCK